MPESGLRTAQIKAEKTAEKSSVCMHTLLFLFEGPNLRVLFTLDRNPASTYSNAILTRDVDGYGVT